MTLTELIIDLTTKLADLMDEGFENPGSFPVTVRTLPDFEDYTDITEVEAEARTDLPQDASVVITVGRGR